MAWQVKEKRVKKKTIKTKNHVMLHIILYIWHYEELHKSIREVADYAHSLQKPCMASQ